MMYLIACYNKQTRVNKLHAVEAEDPICASAAILGNLVFEITEKIILRKPDYIAIAKELSNSFILSDCDKLLKNQADKSYSQHSHYRNPTAMGIYNPRLNRNILIEFDNTRYSEATSTLIRALKESLTPEEFKELEPELKTANESVRSILSLMKAKGYILSEVLNLKLAKIKETI